MSITFSQYSCGLESRATLLNEVIYYTGKKCILETVCDVSATILEIVGVEETFEVMHD